MNTTEISDISVELERIRQVGAGDPLHGLLQGLQLVQEINVRLLHCHAEVWSRIRQRADRAGAMPGGKREVRVIGALTRLESRIAKTAGTILRVRRAVERKRNHED